MSQLKSIQALRAAAAIAVVATHIWPDQFPEGRAGVDVFFAISGFIMVFAAGGAFGAHAASWHFLRRRICRVVPLYWILTLATAGYQLLRGHAPSSNWLILTLLFFPSAFGGGQPIIPSGWTLILEMFFYAVFAVCLAMPFRVGISALFLFLGAISIIGLEFRSDNVVIEYYTSPLMIGFLLGAIIGLIYRSSFRVSAKISIAVILVAILWMAALAALGITTNVLQDRLTFIHWLIPSALIVGAAALCRKDLGNGPAANATVLLGNASYSIYLAHIPILMLLPSFWYHLTGTDILPGWEKLCFAVAGSMLVYLLVERPILKWLTSLRDAGSQSVVTALP